MYRPIQLESDATTSAAGTVGADEIPSRRRRPLADIVQKMAGGIRSVEGETYLGNSNDERIAVHVVVQSEADVDNGHNPDTSYVIRPISVDFRAERALARLVRD